MNMNPVSILNESDDQTQLICLADRLEEQLSRTGALRLLGLSIRIAPTSEACELIDAALRSFSAGQPIPAFETYAQAARDWVYFSTKTERKNYLAAIWQSLSPADQSAFWQYVQRSDAA